MLHSCRWCSLLYVDLFSKGRIKFIFQSFICDFSFKENKEKKRDILNKFSPKLEKIWKEFITDLHCVCEFERERKRQKIKIYKGKSEKKKSIYFLFLCLWVLERNFNLKEYIIIFLVKLNLITIIRIFLVF